MPISYLTSESQLDETQKLELIARTDAQSVCIANLGERMAPVSADQKSIIHLYNDQLRQVTVALIQDRINVGQFHGARKNTIAVAEEAQTTSMQLLFADLGGQHQAEIGQRNAERQAAYQRFQQGLMNASAAFNAGTPAFNSTTSLAPSSTNGFSMTGYFVSQETFGLNKICYYKVGTTRKALTIGAVELCPLSY